MTANVVPGPSRKLTELGTTRNSRAAGVAGVLVTARVGEGCALAFGVDVAAAVAEVETAFASPRCVGVVVGRSTSPVAVFPALLLQASIVRSSGSRKK